MIGRTIMVCAALAVCLLTGCDGEMAGDGADAAVAEEGFVIRGPVRALEGFEVEPDARLIGYWAVSSGSPNYGYVWGSGAIEGDEFVFRLPDDRPPGAALNNRRPQIDAVLGVGIIVALPASTPIPPDGRVDDPAVRAALDTAIGGAYHHAIIYADGEAFAPGGHFYEEAQWGRDFELDVMMCGEGVEMPDFDHFAPTECREVEVIFGLPLDFVSWT